MNNLPLISIVIPVYKTEAYLDRCVQSVLKQTYGNLEIILVDDGSPDRCPQMCDEWAKKDNRIRVIHKANGGGAQARNAGLDAATGEYIGFVDSDDYIHPLMYNRLFDILKANQCDIAECGYCLTESDACSEYESSSYDPVILDTVAAMQENIRDKICRQLVWNKLYSNHVIGSIRMVEGKTIDDEFFTYQIIANAKKVVVIEDKLYYYRQQNNSIMHQTYSIKWLEAVEAKVCRQEYLEAHMPELAGKGRLNLLFTCMWHGQMALKNLNKRDADQVFGRLNRTIKEYFPRRDDLCGMKITHRVWIWMCRIAFKRACMLRNLLGIGA